MLKSKFKRKTNAHNPVSHQMTQPMVMRVSNDRTRTRPDYVPDAAENLDGVFGLLADDELSAAEKARMQRGEDERAAKAAGLEPPHIQAQKLWTPAAVWGRVIDMYKTLKPSKAPKASIETPAKAGRK